MRIFRGTWIAPAALLCSLLFTGAAQSQDNNTYLYIAHAVSGRNISSATNPAFPIDVLVDGQVCIAKDEAFGEIRGPFTSAAGTYSFAVSMANTAAPCSNPAIYSVTADLSAGQTYYGILTLDGNNQVAAQLYQADFSSIPMGQSRVVVANSTNQNLTASLSGNGSDSVDIGANSLQEANIPSGMYTGNVYLQGTSTAEAGPESINLMSRDLYFYVLGGSANNSSVQILGPKVIKDVF